MDANLVINAIIRHTVVLIAHLAVGPRKPLGHIADQVLLQLATELEDQGLSKAVIADMFGMTLRNYRRRFPAERDAAPGQQAQYLLRHQIFTHIETQKQATRDEIVDRFARGEPRKATSCLSDLVKMRLLSKTGTGGQTLYIPTPQSVRQDDDLTQALDQLVQVTIFRLTPRAEPTTAAILKEHLSGLADDTLTASLQRLVGQGRVMVHDQMGQEEAAYSCDQCVLTMDEDAEGWEAAVLDHYQAAVTAMVTKLRRKMGDDDGPQDPVGGSTYTFGIWDGHPMEEEVLNFMDRVRAEASALRQRVRQSVKDAKADHQMPAQGQKRVVFYMGQMVKRLEQ